MSLNVCALFLRLANEDQWILKEPPSWWRALWQISKNYHFGFFLVEALFIRLSWIVSQSLTIFIVLFCLLLIVISQVKNIIFVTYISTKYKFCNVVSFIVKHICFVDFSFVCLFFYFWTKHRLIWPICALNVNILCSERALIKQVIYYYHSNRTHKAFPYVIELEVL